MERENYLGLHNLVSAPGSRKSAKRLGRGESSGHGKTCGRGHKGQKSRKSGNVRIGFEGGQNPLSRRLPKHGFRSLKPKFTPINLASLGERFEEGASINPPALLAAGLIRNMNGKIKILANGEPKKGLNLEIHAISASARKKIEDLGGEVKILK